jgi:acyl carrier protein
MDIVTILENFITTDLVKKKISISPDESLIRSGVLDSLTLLQLIAFIEEYFSIKITDKEMNPDNFQTINVIKAFVEKKINPHAG